MPHKRSPKKLEERLARKFVYQNSVSAPRLNDPNEVVERIFKGTSDQVREHVLKEIQGERQGIIPDYPQGLVFSDSNGMGFFDVTHP
jgi:hypothetical protein